ncbi:MAG TPA: PIN domain-containing protein [Actinomycetota bacterium]
MVRGGLTLDAGVLIAVDRSDGRAANLRKFALRRQLPMKVPAAVLAQAWRGPSNVRLVRFLREVSIVDLDEPLAKAAGLLCARAGTSDVVDASVVVAALGSGDDVVTTDRSDLERLARAAGGVRVLDFDAL